MPEPTSQQTDYDPAAVQHTMAFTRALLQELPRGTWFGPPEEPSADAPEIDRLAASSAGKSERPRPSLRRNG